MTKQLLANDESNNSNKNFIKFYNLFDEVFNKRNTLRKKIVRQNRMGKYWYGYILRIVEGSNCFLCSKLYKNDQSMNNDLTGEYTKSVIIRIENIT